MKLLELHVENFGKLTGVDLSFNEQLNTICQPNGWGKSSLIAFIKAMFYGMPKKGNNKIYKAERSKYKPWQGGVFGGSIQFLCEKGRYQIIRTFGDTPESDTFECINLNTGLKCDDFTKNIGYELFGVGVETFEITAYFEQLNFVGGLNDELRANLSGTNKFENDLNNFEQAQKQIQLKIRQLKTDMPKPAEIESRIMASKDLESSIAQHISEKKEMEDKALEEKLQAKNIETNLQTLVKQHSILEEKRKEKNQIENEIFKLQQSYADALSQKLQIDTAHAASMQDNNCKKETDHHSSKVSMWTCFGGFSVLTVLFAVLAGTGIVNYILGICMTVLSMLCMGVILLVGKKVHREPSEHIHLKDIISRQEQLQENEISLNTKISNLKNELQAKQQQLKSFEESDIVTTEKIDSDSRLIEQQRGMLYDLQKSYSLHQMQCAHLASQVDDFEERFNILQEEIAKMKDVSSENGKKIELLDKTLLFMKQAAENVCGRFMQPMQTSFDNIYQKIAGEDKKIQLDIHLDAAEMTGIGNKEFPFLSQGYRDIIATCRRFVLIDTVYQKEKPLLLLDDTFVNLDQNKLNTMKSLLLEFAKKYQIIYMVCHPKNCIELVDN